MPSEQSSPIGHPSRPVVLLVEDEALIRYDAAEGLREAGWEVLEAGSGERALELLAGGARIDAVLTDINLSGQLTGWDVAEVSRASYPEIPVVYVSGKSVEKARTVPGSIFLSKPFQAAEVIAAFHALR